MPPAKSDAAPAAKGADEDSFDFDFGFGTPTAPQREAEASPPRHPVDDEGDGDGAGADQHEGEDREQAASAEEDADPIADLIKAELGGPQAHEPAAAPRTDYPASVEAVPARTFGRSSVQAPVLIGHPARSAQAAPVQPEQRQQQPARQEPRQEPKLEGGDRFSVAPVFGLGSGQPRQDPPADHDTDPMAEIENLIGEAVRVQMADPEPSPPQEREPRQAQQPPPVVPPLTTGFAPRRAGLKDVESRARSAEAAILAAAAATGAEVGRVEPSVGGGDAPYRRSKVKAPNTRSFGGMRQYLGMGVALVLLLAAGFGLYWVLGMGRGDPDSAPVLTADTSPVKEEPAAPAADTAEVPRSVVFDEIDGVAGNDEAETLVSRDETADTPITEVARVEEPEVTESGLANRRVRTVTVRPDGTIVSADEAVAGTEALPVDRPNVPDLPGLSEQPNGLLAATSDAPLVAPTPAEDAATAAADAAATGAAEDPIAALVAGTATATGATELPEIDANGETSEVAALDREPDEPVVFDGSLAAPTPAPRPTDRSRLAGAGQAAASTPATTATANAPASLPLVSLTGDQSAATPAPPVDANAYVQLASLPSEGEARSQVNAMQSRWGNLFGGQSLVVQRAELGGGRVTYRLRLPTGSLQEATQICASIKANGGDCFATNG
ncbi:MAG TPA: SPOR domain-containing protein [Devosiaceae bacterium]|nr:SPOR domain-containing protein [Devosiaceae bacterium]